jgi:hypothetical protein
VALKNPEAPPVLFEAVRGWLLACRFEPSKDLRSGQPVAVKIIQPFVFKRV